MTSQIGDLMQRYRRDGATAVAPEPMVETAEDAERRKAAATEHRRNRWTRRLPKRYASAALADLTAEQDPQGRIARWLASDSQTLVLVSPTSGIGKTHAAYAIGAAAVDSGLWAEAWTTTRLLSDMRPDANPEAEYNATHCDLLVLDDLGRENDSGWTRQQIHLVLDERGSAPLRTVVTTNLTAEQIADRYGSALLDRLLDDAVIVKATGNPRRVTAGW